MSKISSKYQRDFKNMDYKNPRLVKDQQNKKKKYTRLIGCFACVFVLAILYLIFYSPVFRINEVQINGLEKVNRQNFELLVNDYRFDRTFLIFSNNNYWLFNKKKITNKIFAQYYFEEFSITKKWPNKVDITLKEKQSAINWLTNNLCYHLDLTGLAIEYCEENDGYLIIRDLENVDVRIGGSVINSEDLNYLIDLYQQTKNIVKEDFNLIEIEKQKNLLTIKTEQGTELKFNQNLTVDEQIGRLYTLLGQPSVKEKLQTIRYFDFRFGEKVYYQ